MVIKNLKHLCAGVLLSLLAITSKQMITANAYELDDIQACQIEVENLSSRMDTIDLEISTLEKQIETYGLDYQPYNSYGQVVSSTNISTDTADATYQTNSTSFVQQMSVENNDLTLQDLYISKSMEKMDLESRITALEDEISKLEKIETVTFNSEDVTQLSGMDVEDIRLILQGTALEDLAQDFIDAEQEYQVNAVFLISICALESGWGTSARARRDNNLTGFGVYTDSSKGINSATKRDNILLTAKTLHENYLTKDGKCYKGVSVSAVAKSYCTSDTWSGKISSIGNNLKKACITSYVNELQAQGSLLTDL
jgi:beta-N-acetylglucosaminidase